MPALQPSARKGDPNVATFLTWFLPGAGDLYLGRTRQAFVAFVLIEGLYALGWMLSEGRVFQFLDPELQGVFATILTPEVGNLGAMIAQIKQVGFQPLELSPYSDTIALGAILTALSGIANVFWMAGVHLAARTPDKAPRAGVHPALLAAAAWAVPGLGHFLQGRRKRAAIVFVLLVGFFLWGTWLAGGSNLSRERHFYYWSGQYLVGLPAILAELAAGNLRVTGEIPRVDVGLLYACMPGLLNVLAILDVFGYAERRWLGIEDGPKAELQAGTEAVV